MIRRVPAMPSSFTRSVRRSVTDLLELALPTSCAACGMFLEGGGHATILCDGCDARLYEMRRMPCCGQCASPLPDAAGPCGRCSGKGIPPFQSIARLGTFEETLRGLVHAVKYGRRWPVVNWLAREMEASPRVAAVLDDAQILVPVPLHWTRRIGRGFNQASLLAHALARPRGLIVTHAVRRTRRTPSQTVHHSRAARRRNLLNAFRLTGADLLRDRHVVLVDDVMTSGATLQAVARTIRHGVRTASLSAVVVGTANPLKSDLVAI